MSNDLVYEEIREAIREDLKDLQMLFIKDNENDGWMFTELFYGKDRYARNYDFFMIHLYERIHKNIENLRKSLEEIGK